MIKILILSLISLVFAMEVYSEETSDISTEKIETPSDTAGQLSESSGSDIKSIESLDEASKPIDEISDTVQSQAEPTETLEQIKEEAAKPVTPDQVPKKPLGVREAEGRVIGE